MMSKSEMDVVVESPNHDEGKLIRLLEGQVETFPGNASLMQFFQSGFGESKRLDPKKIALFDDEKSFTFKELDEKSARIAEAIRLFLRENFKNVNPDQDIVIGVCIPPSSELVFILFAIMKMGAAYLPYDVSFPEERVIKITKDSRPVLVISDHHSNVLTKFDAVKDTTKVLSTAVLLKTANELEMAEEQLAITSPFMSPDAFYERTAIVLYTSGSSGEPKGVRLSHRAIMNRLHWQWQTFPFVPEDKCVFKTSLTFVDSVAEIFGPLLQGCSLTVLQKTSTTNPNTFIQKLDQYKITRLVLVPSLLRAMFHTLKLLGSEATVMLESVKLWVCSGETMTKDLVMDFFEYFPKGYTICNFYGSTEIMGDVTYVTFSSKHQVYERSLENHIPIGEPIFNTVIYILTPTLEMCQMDETGEIYVGGYNLAKGYVGMADDPRFIVNPFSKSQGFNRLYKTGDFGKLTETQGKIRTIAYEGRVDSQLKVRGQRVDLSEIEMTINEIHLIAKGKVLCYHPGLEDQTIIAFIVPEGEVHIDRIKNLIDTRLREYERPILRIIEDVPLLVNGKTDRQRLLKMYEQDLEERTNSVDWYNLDLTEGKMDVAKVVVAVMSQVTGTSFEEIGENFGNSFYNIGGSSLNSIQTIVKMREHNCYITIPNFVNSPTIRDIVELSFFLGVDNGEDEDEQDTTLSVLHQAQKVYVTNYLTDEDRDDVLHIIAHSFSHHGDLEKYTDATYAEFQTLIWSMWVPLVEKQLSFIVRRKSDKKAVAVALNFDVYDEPDPEDIQVSKGIGYVLDMLEFLESRQREKLPKGMGKLLHSFMMGTSEEIDESENVFVIQYMEERLIQMAEEKHFFGVMTTNTSPLTQQIASDIHGYEVLAEYQVNHYIAPDTTKPFMLAPDSFKIVCCWKKVGYHKLNAEAIFFHDELAAADEGEDEDDGADQDKRNSDEIATPMMMTNAAPVVQQGGE